MQFESIFIVYVKKYESFIIDITQKSPSIAHLMCIFFYLVGWRGIFSIIYLFGVLSGDRHRFCQITTKYRSFLIYFAINTISRARRYFCDVTIFLIFLRFCSFWVLILLLSMRVSSVLLRQFKGMGITWYCLKCYVIACKKNTKFFYPSST